MYEVRYVPIGIIHTPFKEASGIPVQPLAGRGVPGTVELEAEYCDGLKDLDGFSHIILIYHLHKSAGYSLVARPYLEHRPRGLFSTRSPRRPNPIGISVVRLMGVERCILHVKDLDIIDGTPLLDLKPYVPEIDMREEIRTGWLKGKKGRVATDPADGSGGHTASRKDDRLRTVLDRTYIRDPEPARVRECRRIVDRSQRITVKASRDRRWNVQSRPNH